MNVSFLGSTNSLEVLRNLRTNPIPGVHITPISSGVQTRSLPEVVTNITFNIDINLSVTVMAAVAAYLLGRARRGGGKIDLHLGGKKISTDNPQLIEAELEKYDSRS